MRRVWVLAGAAALLAAGAPGEAQTPDVPPGPCERVEERIPGAPLNVELVTVTDSAFAVTWLTCDGQGSPMPSDTTVSYGTSPDPTSWKTVTLERGTAFHYGEVRGLEPGTTCYYQVFSDGLPGRYDRYHPGSFTSLRLPAGRFLFSFAVMPDVHIGVEVSGLATSEPFEFPPGYRSE